MIHASFAKPDRHTKFLQNSLDTYEKTSLLPRGKLSHRALINGNRIFPFSSQFLIFLTSHIISCQRCISIDRGQGPVVQRLISPNPGLNFNSGFFNSLFKSLLWKFFTILFKTSNDQIASKKIWTEFSLKAFRPGIKFHIDPGLPLPSFEKLKPGL